MPGTKGRPKISLLNLSAEESIRFDGTRREALFPERSRYGIPWRQSGAAKRRAPVQPTST
jgi:hypothetical protein